MVDKAILDLKPYPLQVGAGGAASCQEDGALNARPLATAPQQSA
jgi:hypothetical protein